MNPPTKEDVNPPLIMDDLLVYPSFLSSLKFLETLITTKYKKMQNKIYINFVCHCMYSFLKIGCSLVFCRHLLAIIPSRPMHFKGILSNFLLCGWGGALVSCLCGVITRVSFGNVYIIGDVIIITVTTVTV